MSNNGGDSDNQNDDEAISDADKIIESERAEPAKQAVDLTAVLNSMGETYRANPQQAVRSQDFIQSLHRFVGSQLQIRLTKFALNKRKITVRYGKPEAQVLGATKPKDVDVAVIDPESGPLVIVGIRSQMSSVSKNVLTYYEGIVGECISLQHRFPMSVHAYIYLHPLKAIKEGSTSEFIDHQRYARMYAAVTGRSGPDYKSQRGIFDEFAYLVVDFEQSPPRLRDDIVKSAVPGLDMSIDTLVDRIITTFNARTLFWDVFK